MNPWRPLFWAVFSGWTLFGCSTTSQVGRGHPFSIHEKAELVTWENQSVSISRARAENDTIIFTEAYSGLENSMPRSAIQKVVITRRGKGAWDGLRIGILTGISMGALIGSTAASCSNNSDLFCGPAPTMFLLGLGGLIYGPIIGAINGSNQTYEFIPQIFPAPPPNQSGGISISEPPALGMPEEGGNPGPSAPKSNWTRGIDSIKSRQSRAKDSIKANRKRDRWYAGFETGPAFGNLPSGPRSVAGREAGDGGWLTSGSLGTTLNSGWIAGIRLSRGALERAHAYDLEGMARGYGKTGSITDIRLETEYFPWKKGVFTEGTIGYGYYEYQDISGTPVVTLSGHGMSGSIGAGYAFWLGKSFNLVLKLELLGARYLDDANHAKLKPSMGLFWF